MAWKTDGSVHEEGIANEVNLRTRLLHGGLAASLFPDLLSEFEVRHRGGTQYKQDIEVSDLHTTKMISAKRKKSIYTGSFDYINTSRVINQNSFFNPLKNIVSSLKNSESSVSKARKTFTDASHDMMKEMSGDMLKQILKEHVADKNKDMTMIVTDTTTKTDYAYNFKDTPLYDAICRYTPVFKWGRGKTSARIVFNDSEGNEYDLGLRGRLVLNNGVKALLGKSNANKSSQAVFKVQQDKVAEMLVKIPTLQTINY